MINYRFNVLKTSRTYSSCIIETISLNNNFPISLVANILLSASMSLTLQDTPYKWIDIGFVPV